MTIVKLVLEKNYHINSNTEITKRSAKKKTTTKSDLLQYLGLMDEEYEKTLVILASVMKGLSTYKAYKRYLFESGILLWCIKQADKQVIVMNGLGTRRF